MLRRLQMALCMQQLRFCTPVCDAFPCQSHLQCMVQLGRQWMQLTVCCLSSSVKACFALLCIASRVPQSQSRNKHASSQIRCLRPCHYANMRFWFPISMSKTVCKALAPSGHSMRLLYCTCVFVLSLTNDQLHVPECFVFAGMPKARSGGGVGRYCPRP